MQPTIVTGVDYFFARFIIKIDTITCTKYYLRSGILHLLNLVFKGQKKAWFCKITETFYMVQQEDSLKDLFLTYD